MRQPGFKEIVEKLDLRFRHRVPIIHQTETTECGLACLAMVSSYYGHSVDLFALRRQFNITSRGATLAGVKSMATQMGMTSRALSLDLGEIRELKLPCILHWDFNHFVVLVEASNNQFVLHDPARGKRKVGVAEMSQHFTGVAMELWPNSEFTPKKEKNRLGLRQLIGSIHGIKGTLSKIFFLSIVIEAIGLIMPVGTQLVMDHAIPASDHGLLMLICIGLAFFILLRAGISSLRAWTSLVMGTLINVQWQSGLFQHMLRLPLDFFERRQLGDIQSRFGSLDTVRETFTNSTVGAIMDGIMVVGLFIMMMLYGGWLVWVVLGITAVYVLFRIFTYPSYRQYSEEVLTYQARANSYFMETLYGITAVKMQGMTDRRSAQWLNLKIDAINAGIKVSKLDLLFGGINTFIMTVDQVVILWIGATMVMDNHMTIGMFVAFGSYRGQFSDRAASLTNFVLRLRMMSLHNERISDIALQEKEARKPDIPYEKGMVPAALQVKGLSFRYDSQSAPVFHDINIDIQPGESVAIVGPSGGGKTTLMKVMCGLFEPSEGKVLVNETDIWQLGVNNYHKMIACVMQDDRLFSGSIAENICSFADEMDEEWMMQCAQASYIHEFIMTLPMGYETLVGELGEGLSGGQRQRLFIARALYRKPSVLFMDEATSALDNDSEAAVNNAIRQLQITRVIIAHRETTVASTDRRIQVG
ncbi:Toxin RTX-I translocation ATP-binding protein [Halomonadaceae bacterium LMG 33818]|uniref:peptidase domain-containing ABC transporter n=1 Tax=Cernens ardua TaxID=3402176 RepID=UPI003EDC20AF